MIIVVDDDSRIRLATATALRAAGHDVLDFDSGIAALAGLPDIPGVRLIVSDVQMPGLSGPEFVKAALVLQPQAKVVFMSGDIGDISESAFAPWSLMAKPFTAKALTQLVDELLNE